MLGGHPDVVLSKLSSAATLLPEPRARPGLHHSHTKRRVEHKRLSYASARGQGQPSIYEYSGWSLRQNTAC
jgi:hypothetical protein